MKRFLIGTLVVAGAWSFAACTVKSSDDDDNGGEAGDTHSTGGTSGKGGSSSKGGSAGAATGGKGGSAGYATGGSGGDAQGGSDPQGGSSGSAGSGAKAGSGGWGGDAVGGAAGQSVGGGNAGGYAGAPDQPGGGGGEGGEPSVGGVQHGSCTVPCELELAPTGDLPGDSAVVVYDFEHDTATLTSDAQASLDSEWVIGFTFETDPQHGYGSWSRNSWWFAFTEPLVYDDDTYSMSQNVEVTSQMINPATDQIVLVKFSFGDHTVRVLDARVPACSDATSGACASATDCSSVDAGNGGVSSACSACYSSFESCVDSACSEECPGQGGNACMSCEVENCHTAFLDCSGLDYMPRGTLTWPLN